MMKPNFKLMPPQWIEYPEFTEFSMGWRMGGGEDYRYQFWDWYEALTSAQQQEYQDPLLLGISHQFHQSYRCSSSQ